MQKWQCRIAPSLGDGFAGTPNEVWGTVDYTNQDDPAVFFGMYGLPDFYALWRHRGPKMILWAGTDILHMRKGYWLEDGGGIKLYPEPIARWIDKNCENYVENEVEAENLEWLGIKSKVVPSFLGNMDDYPLLYKHSSRPKVYASVSGDNFDTYKWHEIDGLARKHDDIEFHLYGNKTFYPSVSPNVIVHGRVSQEEMNEEIKHMQAGIRLLDHDGCSEIVAKGLLWGQWVISRIPYGNPKDPYTLYPDEIGDLVHLRDPNTSGRNWFISKANRYPWATK